MDALDLRKYLLPGLLVAGLIVGASLFWREHLPAPPAIVLPNADAFARHPANRARAPIPLHHLPGEPIPEADTLQLNALDAEQEEAIMDLVRRIVARSPVDALAWAARAHDPTRADLLYLLVIRAWAESDPDGALRWARRPKARLREQGTYAALLGMAQQPALAVPLGVRLMGEEPNKAGEYGYALLDDLASAEQFAAAAQFADRSPSEFRLDWMATAFGRWAGVRPEEAVAALEALRGTDSRAPAFEAVVQGWAEAQPAGLADYAISLPTSDERAYALEAAMYAWNLQDPAAFAQWMTQRGPTAGPEFDDGRAALAAQADTANRDPAAAMGWAEGINDASLRYETAMRVLADWARVDLAAARDYAENATWPNDGQRRDLLLAVGLGIDGNPLPGAPPVTPATAQQATR